MRSCATEKEQRRVKETKEAADGIAAGTQEAAAWHGGRCLRAQKRRSRNSLLMHSGPLRGVARRLQERKLPAGFRAGQADSTELREQQQRSE